MIILAYILAIIGLLGSIVPGLAGPPFSWAALLVAGFSDKIEFTTPFLIVTAAVAVVITLLDYVVPSWSTKRHGGSKAGVWGCNIGLVISIIGLPFGPTGLIGVVFWPFVGALAGELLSVDVCGIEARLSRRYREAMRAAWGAFVGFLTGTGLKLAYAIFAIVMLITRLV